MSGKNYLKIAIALLLALLVQSQSVVRPPPYVGLPTQDGLARLFFNARTTRRDPSLSVSCFAGYIAESNASGEEFSRDYAACLDTARNSRRGIEKDFIEKRQQIERTAKQVCDALTTCNRVNSTLDSFNCHASVGSNNTVATYTISGNATEAASVLLERYRVIDLKHEQCNRLAERRYVENSSHNYTYLQDCLDGRVKPKQPPTTTSSTTTTTTTTTTEAPTTTEASNTDSPIDLEDQFKQLLNLLN